MKAAIWILFVLVATVWTGAVAASVALLDWAVSAVASARVGELAGGVADWPVPAWLAMWIDPALLKELQVAGVGLIHWLADSSPGLSGVMDWLTPLMWMGWGVVLVLLLVGAGGLHWLVGRLNQPGVPQQRS